uniref:Uncharacterized protein n=1 Tax=Arundo donax TaxID=35708 RepID=A0A0A9G0D3_ARUDO
MINKYQQVDNRKHYERNRHLSSNITTTMRRSEQAVLISVRDGNSN